MNYLTLNGKRIDLTDEQVKEIEKSFGFNKVKLSEIAVGKTFEIGKYEFVVLEHLGDDTRIILKGLLPEKSTFGKNNNFADGECVVRERLKTFADEIGSIVGEDNLVVHTVDLTSDDGLDDYGTTTARMSLLTCKHYRKYVRILDEYKVDKWWWLATPYSTPTHDDASWVKSVSPGGYVHLNCCSDRRRGVRPFCILKSNIFVSK